MKKVSFLIRDDIGSIGIIAVILMVVFLGLLAMVIDLGHLHTVQSELRNAADACALRGARGFLPDSIPVTGLSPTPMNPDPLNAKTQANLTIRENRSDNVALTDLPTDEMELGIWYYKAGESPDSNQQLQPWVWPPPWGKYVGPGITVPVKRDASHNVGPVSMTLAQLFGKPAVPVNKVKATAALSGVGGFVPGSPALPFGPMKQYVPEEPGLFVGTFRNDNNDTFGWSNLNPADTQPSANELKKIMNQGALYDCPFGSVIGVQNGVDASVIQAMTKQTPLNRFGLQPDPSLGPNIYTPSTETYANTVYMLPVYETLGDPERFTQGAIVGAVPVKIIEVATSPDNYIKVDILSGTPTWVVPGYGGGVWYGILATEPKLVQ